MSALPPPFDRRLDFVVRSNGWRATALALLPITGIAVAGDVAFGGALAYQLRYGMSRIERYVVYLDADYRPISADPADGSPALRSGAYVQAAERWVKLLRRRPPGASLNGSPANRAVADARAEAQTFTSRRLWEDVLYPALDAGDRKLGDKEVTLDGDPQAVVVRRQDGKEDRDERSARVLVTWTETVHGAVNETSKWSAVLNMIDHGGASRETGDNPLDLWVVDYSVSHQETGR